MNTETEVDLEPPMDPDDYLVLFIVVLLVAAAAFVFRRS